MQKVAAMWSERGHIPISLQMTKYLWLHLQQVTCPPEREHVLNCIFLHSFSIALKLHRNNFILVQNCRAVKVMAGMRRSQHYVRGNLGCQA